MKKSSLILLFIAATISLSAQRMNEPVTVELFNDTPILFNPTDYPNGVVEKEGLLYLGNGRIVLKKVTIPTFSNYTEAEIEITLVSNGDTWDKSGSCFVIPRESAISMIDVAADRAAYPPHDPERYEELAGIVQGEGYLPTVELMRFMTPFGVGHYSSNDDSVSARRRPVYVDGWAENVNWKQEVTDLLPLLEGEAYVGIYVDTWTPEGYKVDAKLTFTESAIKGDTKPDLHVEPLINTNYYIGQRHPISSRARMWRLTSRSLRTRRTRLKYITTGHGGHSGGDESDHSKIYYMGWRGGTDLPWRTDCASFRMV